MAEVSLKLSLGSFSVEVSGPEEYVDRRFEELINRYLSGAKPTSGDGASVSTEAPAAAVAAGKGMSPAEFIKKANAKNQSDQAMVLAYYLEKNRATSSFTSTELAELAKEVRRPFANASDLVARLSSRGLMMSAGDKEGQRPLIDATWKRYSAGFVERSTRCCLPSAQAGGRFASMIRFSSDFMIWCSLGSPKSARTYRPLEYLQRSSN